MSDTGVLAEQPSASGSVVPVPAEVALRGAEADPCACRWGRVRCILFRFGLLYYLLFFLPFPLSPLASLTAFPPLGWLGAAAGGAAKWYAQEVNQATYWVGRHVLRLPEHGPGAIILHESGSGDTMILWVQTFCFLMLALAGTVIWSIADRRRAAYPRLHWAFRTYVRLALASWMFTYGFAKVVPIQFQPPSPDWLIQSYGESTPMRLLWTFMGASPAYTMFAGASEVIGGFLLLFRRTATLGGLVSAGVMLNVFALNMCYDVPVKGFSFHLMVAGLLVALPDMPRLFNAIVLNRAVGASPSVFRIPSRWKRWTLVAVELATMLIIAGPDLWSVTMHWREMGMNVPKSPLYGLYEVESFEVDGKARPPLTTDAMRWRRFVITKGVRRMQQQDPAQPAPWSGFAMIQHMSDAKEYLRVTFQDHPTEIELSAPGGPNGPGPKYTLLWTEPAPGKVVLEGEYLDEEIRVALRKVPESEFTLYKRGFNWVQEMPVNR